jgi:hypothetical protein
LQADILSIIDNSRFISGSGCIHLWEKSAKNNFPAFSTSSC